MPFCEARCSYCDFYAVARGDALGRRYPEALDAEAAARTPPGFAPVTAFVGGGTPTALEDDEFARVLETVGGVARPGGRLREWSVECNPGSLTPRKAALMHDAGVTRASIGVQSFDDRVLRSVGRVHDAATARDAVRVARDGGISQVSIDLLFAVPGQGIDGFRRDLEEALRLGTDHVSAYALIFEPGTPLARHLEAGRVAAEPDDLELEMLRLARDELQAAGFERYEVSNFARPGARALHNVNYWRNGEYLGLGPSAVSYLGGERRGNVADWREWERRVLAGEDPLAGSERLTGDRAAAEELMLRMRLAEGAPLAAVSRRWGIDLRARFDALWRRFEEAGLVEFDAAGDVVRFSDRGLEVADGVIAEFLTATL